MTDEEIIEQFRSKIDAVTTSLQLNTRHPSDTLNHWKDLFHDKRVITKMGESLGTVNVHLDPTSHVFVSVGGSIFPIGHLQALVDAGSLSVAAS